jgi:LysM repeat protein
MHRQNRVAHQHEYSFLQTSGEVRRFAELGLLVRLRGNQNYMLARVSHPYARPAVKLFVERLAAQYRGACGEKLVITSLTRPAREQPRNASDLSVHPAGMAVDLRISKKRSCRKWVEKTLLTLEKQGVLDTTRERRPPHYHIALFPEPYRRHVARVASTDAPLRVASATRQPARTARATTVTRRVSAPRRATPLRSATPAGTAVPAGTAGPVGTAFLLTGTPLPAAPAAVTGVPTGSVVPAELVGAATLAAAAPGSELASLDAAAQGATEEGEATAQDTDGGEASAAGAAEATVTTYRIHRGDTLWSIARRYGTTVRALRALNGLKSSRVVVGQRITVPAAAGADGS